uniref:ARAD1B16808p n=1 Tax=Blastobotrys adeninivorans TaxID=409370 RepID=A0A060TCI9_BLAAD
MAKRHKKGKGKAESKPNKANKPRKGGKGAKKAIKAAKGNRPPPQEIIDKVVIHSLKSEARNTARHALQSYGRKTNFRHFPVQFVKATEVYDPSGFLARLKGLTVADPDQPANAKPDLTCGPELESKDHQLEQIEQDTGSDPESEPEHESQQPMDSADKAPEIAELEGKVPEMVELESVEQDTIQTESDPVIEIEIEQTIEETITPAASESAKSVEQKTIEDLADDEEDDVSDSVGGAAPFFSDTEGDPSLKDESRKPTIVPFYQKQKPEMINITRPPVNSQDDSSESNSDNPENNDDSDDSDDSIDMDEFDDDVDDSLGNVDIDGVDIDDFDDSDEDDEDDSDDDLPNRNDTSGEMDVDSDIDLDTLKRFMHQDIGGSEFYSGSQDDLSDEGEQSEEDDVGQIISETLSTIVEITNTRFGVEGREFLVLFMGEDTPRYVPARQLYEFGTGAGHSLRSVRKALRDIGGEISDNDVENDFPEYFQDDYSDEYNEQQGEYESLEDEYNPEGAELDMVIQNLVQDSDTMGKRGKKRADAILDSYGSSKIPKPHKRSSKMPNWGDDVDPEIRKMLVQQWQQRKDLNKIFHEQQTSLKKQKRKQKKQERREKWSQEVHLRDKYPEVMTFDDIITEIEQFLTDSSLNTIALPPMDSKCRKLLKNLAPAYNLKYVTRNIGHKSIFFVKTPRSHIQNKNHGIIANVKKKRTLFPRTDLPKSHSKSTGPAQARAKAHHREGDIVGHAAQEIESDNIGRQLLEKMGWKRGMGLGTTNIGPTEPVVAVVKRSKVGLGF